ncbi:hypothetical protein EHQ12_01295 [Leptospira gomenensis]|uniref:Uncharacterized protein n=1 Tax=Leptospira gomenensis TaxID=2484974 RepID=A0A5F1YZ98_9LEPT|nr:hypothetical protein [Leptospira gomenensis]TGK34451.1 hypothetical protein EHQ17_08460 [Leptospira gomenensis]TGK41837.1 hypothetical protein EHQ07_15430 [Leptospira gomenensis]TGK44774.1 hypothetical protein EHQ12_01295 [Leptospira gomenensis]TGK65161.1 hypothetical protein EHQ13_05810 [Leptospira gomenensis]
MKNGGNSVEIVIGNKVETIPFSRIESILPDFPAKKNKTDSVGQIPKKPKVLENPETDKALKVSETRKIVEVSNVAETSETPKVREEIPDVALDPKDVNAKNPGKKSRWRLLQALLPFWSPLLLSDRGSQQLLGGLMIFTKLFILYEGRTYFQKPRPYFAFGQEDLSPQGRQDFYLTFGAFLSSPTGNNAASAAFLLYQFGLKGSDYVVSSNGTRMEEELFYERRRNYAYLLLTAITLDIFLSNRDLSSGDLKSVSVSTSDGGRANSLSFTWVF